MSGLRKLISIYARIGRTYVSWAPLLLLVATVVFLPLGLLDAISTETEVETLGHNGFEVAALIGAVAALTATSLLGEVFYAGAVAVSLTHPREEPAPSLVAIARDLDYRRLIGVDLIYVLIVVIGLTLLFVPGVLAFVWLGLAGPVVEIERRTVLGALRRSFSLVRGSFWTVALVLIPIEIVGDAIGEGLTEAVHGLLGDSFVATWLADAAANIALTPVFAVAAVLLTVDLIAAKDGTGPRINHSPAPTPATA